ncbi:MAG TPA: PilZ domain-containing protein [Polyangiaceae bacterium]|nr:PilZ domain-containing protein [Polyangiaceae bacterium]
MADQRKHHRVPVSWEVTCIQEDGVSFIGLIKDLSLGGLFVESKGTPAFDAKLTLVVRGVTPRELRLPAIVRWSEPHGFGVQFGLLGAYATHVIVDLVKKHTS